MVDLPVFEPLSISYYSFLRGVESPENLVAQAFQSGFVGISVNDYGNFLGSLRACISAEDLGVSTFLSTRITLEDCSCVEFILFPLNYDGYKQICKILTRQNFLGRLVISDIKRTKLDIALVLKFNGFYGLNSDYFLQLNQIFPYVFVTAVPTSSRLFNLAKSFASKFNLRFLASLDPAFLNHLSVMTADCLTATRVKKKLSELNPEERPLNHCLFRDVRFYLDSFDPSLIKNNLYLHNLLDPSLFRKLIQRFPRSKTFNDNQLRELCDKKLKEKKLDHPKYHNMLEKELELISELNYERFFLICHEITEFARQKDILCQGRGAAANSLVCFLLGITCVHPDEIDFLFERFINRARSEPPDIDIDFESDKRDEVFEFIFNKYRGRSALISALSTFRLRSAIRDVGRALGVPFSAILKVTKLCSAWIEGSGGPSISKFVELTHIDDRIANIWKQVSLNFLQLPRHFTQHVGGVLLHSEPIWTLAPVYESKSDNRLMIQLTKSEIDDLKFVKIDILGLKMLSAIQNSIKLLNTDGINILPSDIKADDPEVFDMLSKGFTIGVFQVESRAQQAMITKLKPKTFYDLVIEVAIVRPGPIVGEMVHPYIRRRQGLEKVHFPDEKIKSILGKTLGVPLFQEQALRLAKEVAFFSDKELEEFRKALRLYPQKNDVIEKFKQKLRQTLIELHYEPEFVELCIKQIKGFSQYGFPESHAASFAKLVYFSAYLKKRYPAYFYAGILNSQPVGFYNPRQILTDAKNFGVEIVSHDINRSFFDCTVTNRKLLLGFNLIKGLIKEEVAKILEERDIKGSFKSVGDFLKRARVSEKTLVGLVEAGAFDSLYQNRRQLLLDIFSERRIRKSLEYNLNHKFFYDALTKEFAIEYSFLKQLKNQLNIKAFTYEDIMKMKPKIGSKILVFGLAAIKQRPETAKGFMFICLEDDKGFINLVVNPTCFQKHSDIIISSDVLLCDGILEAYVADLIPYVKVIKFYELTSFSLGK
ncbi:MAG: DNA polymerase III subunit alpha [Deltaproteobacteria bacterium]|nr:DNA polymerase III subunit alpha [Deltaproteobacteria bacterium]